MYILASGIIGDPIVIYIVLLLSIAIIVSLLLWEAFRRSDNTVMAIMTSLLGVAAMICLFISVYHFDKPMSKEKAYPRVEKMEYENHEYLLFREKFSIVVIHNPDCECRKFFKLHKEK